MVRRNISRFNILGAVLATGWCLLGAQSSNSSALQVLRFQAASIAGEVVGKIRPALTDSSHINLGVEARLARSLVENAFLDVLGKAGLNAILAPAESPTASLLQIFAVDEVVRYSAIDQGQYQRSIQMTLDARWQLSPNEEMRFLGSFHRSSIDTVRQREELRLLGLQGEGANSGTTSFFEKIAGPVLMITGAFLIVYLFFTVRN